MLKIVIITILLIPILIFAFNYNANYINGYLALQFSDATSTVSVYVDGDNIINTSLDMVKIYVGKKSFNLSLKYKEKFYSQQIGVKPYCNIIPLSKTSTTITYKLLFDNMIDSIPEIRVYSNGLQAFFSYAKIDSRSIKLTLPILNDTKYFKFYIKGYLVKYEDSLTNIVDVNNDFKVAMSVYTDFNKDFYWITIAAKYWGYFNGEPKLTIKSSDINIDISKYFTNKGNYIFGTYKYKKSYLSDGEYNLVLKVGGYEKKYRFFVYKSIAFFPDIHKQLSVKIYKLYTVKPGDTLYYIAVNNNTDVQSLIKINNFENGDNIIAGQKILIGKVRFAPSPDTIVVLEDDSRLYFYHNHKLINYFFVSPGFKGKTPLGIFQIIRKIKNPTLYWEGEVIPPLSPINGLGTRFLQLSDPQYGIHGTTKPWEIGRRVSHGCVRMMNHDVEEIFNLVQVGTKVIIVKNFNDLNLLYKSKSAFGLK